MNKKEYKFLDDKLAELVENDIISSEQYENAKIYYHNGKTNKSVITIFSAIGVLLIALSIITLFAINWKNISKEFKVIISFVPLIITSVMLYLYMKNENSKMKLFTSIVAPSAIIATNSLISQVFHIQTEMYELLFVSLIMFLPIAFILKNYVSIIVYGIGTFLYALSVASSYLSESIILLNILIIWLPLIIYNIKNYINNRKDGKNMLMWVINVSILTIIILLKEFLRPDVFLIYLYMVYFITKIIFNGDNILNRILSFLFIGYLILSCIDPFMFIFVEEIDFGFDTAIISIIILALIYLSRAYKNPKEYFIFLFILILQYIRIDENIMFICVNLIALALGVYIIIEGNKKNSYKEIKKGVFVVLLIVMLRFINSDISFMGKSIMFLITGIGFVIGSNIIKKRIGGKKDE